MDNSPANLRLVRLRTELEEIKDPSYPDDLLDLLRNWEAKAIPIIQRDWPHSFHEFQGLFPSPNAWRRFDVARFGQYFEASSTMENLVAAWEEDKKTSTDVKNKLINFLDGLLSIASSNPDCYINKMIRQEECTYTENLPKILLVAVTETEVKSVIEVFGTGINKKEINRKIYFDLGQVGGAHVFMAQSQMGSGTPGGAALTISNGITDLSPQAVIMVGIAYGVNRRKQKIGDVLVSRQLTSYEPQRIGTSKETGEKIVRPRGGRNNASTYLIDKFQSGVIDWNGAKVQFGLILSGEKLIDNEDYREDLLHLEPEAIGGEMEGSGLYAACEEKQVNWILVKAICDWADGNKSRNKDKNQKKAAESAAQFVYHVLQQCQWK